MTSATLFVLALSPAATAAAQPPYPASSRPTSALHVISSHGRTPAELLCLDSFAGLIARTSPRLYRVSDSSWDTDTSDSYAHWLRQMRASGVAVNVSLLNATVPRIIAALAADAGLSYILAEGTTSCAAASAVDGAAWRFAGRSCGPSSVWSWSSVDSVSAALTLAAAKENLIVVADPTLAAALEAVGVKQHSDVRGKTVGDVLQQPGVFEGLSKDIFIFQDPSKSAFLGDYATFSRAASLPFGGEPAAQMALLGARNASHGGPGAAFGWGPENSYVSTCNAAGVYVHASDFCTNLAALSNFIGGRLAKPPSVEKTAADSPRAGSAAAVPRHTVAFVMTDGDNLQWVLGPWSTDKRWWASGTRGSTPVGWTLSPALAHVAPAALALVRCTDSRLEAAGRAACTPSLWRHAPTVSFASEPRAGADRSKPERVGRAGGRPIGRGLRLSNYVAGELAATVCRADVRGHETRWDAPRQRTGPGRRGARRRASRAFAQRERYRWCALLLVGRRVLGAGGPYVARGHQAGRQRQGQPVGRRHGRHDT